jgi:DNA-binding CsgD family transcriptional regulator
LENYLKAHPRTKFVRSSDIFPLASKLRQSDFYRQYMAPQKRHHAIGLFFWRRQKLDCVIVIMRTGPQGDITEAQMDLLQHLYPQFQTSLDRLAAQEREHSICKAFEEFLGRLPLPTILLGWNLKVIYQNKAGREFCALWQRGPDVARMMKTDAALPLEMADGCRALKKQWQQSRRRDAQTAELRPLVMHHPAQPHLRATITLRQNDFAAVARPSFLVEGEEFPRHSLPAPDGDTARLSHLARLTRREQQVTELVCGGRSNQEIADDAALSVAMVKKHLHAIFRKLEVTSRSRLITLMR